MKTTFDCAIVGGGIIGMLTAKVLSAQGLRVVLLDKQVMGHESSWAGGGILSPLYPWRYADAVTVLAKYSQQHYPALVEELLAATGIDPELELSGLLILDCDELPQAQPWAERWGYSLQHLEQAAISKLEPQLRSPPAQAIWFPQVQSIRNPRLVRALRQYLLQQQIVFQENCEVTAIQTQQGRVLGVETSQGHIRAERVIVSSGAWSTNLLKKLGITLEVQPVRGQMLLFHAEPGFLQHIVLSKDRYVIPRRDGRILVGSTLEYVQFDKRTTAQAREALYQEALRILPGLANYPVEAHWAGLRPGRESGIPYICEIPEVSGLYLCAGHFRNGLVLAPASVRALADIVLSRESPFELAAYQL